MKNKGLDDIKEEIAVVFKRYKELAIVDLGVLVDDGAEIFKTFEKRGAKRVVVKF